MNIKYTPIDSKLFVDNRQKFKSELKSKSIAIFNSNDEMPRSGDQNFTFRQNADLFYLSGIDQEETILVIFPDSPLPQYKEMLFVRKTNERIAIWEGHKYTKEEARATSGIQSVFWTEEFNSIVPMLMHHADYVYLNINENDRHSTEVPYRDMRFAREWKNRFPGHTYERLGQIMAKLRSHKHEIEVQLIRQAIKHTESALRRVLKFMKPGVMEYEVEAEIIHEFIRNRCSGHAYSPIIASGYSACVLHYNENNKPCNDGDLVLMDFGAEYANYAADLTRTVPVNGKFTPRQKEVYNAVLRVMRAATQMLVAGNFIEKYHAEVGKLMEEELIKLKLLTPDDIKNQDPDWPAYKKYFMHGTSHFLGLDVHDVGNKYLAMEPGMIFTCEPGIYIPEEKMGIRIENNILITNGAPIDLMDTMPVEVDEIESLMNS